MSKRCRATLDSRLLRKARLHELGPEGGRLQTHSSCAPRCALAGELLATRADAYVRLLRRLLGDDPEAPADLPR